MAVKWAEKARRWWHDGRSDQQWEQVQAYRGHCKTFGKLAKVIVKHARRANSEEQFAYSERFYFILMKYAADLCGESVRLRKQSRSLNWGDYNNELEEPCDTPFGI